MNVLKAIIQGSFTLILTLVIVGTLFLGWLLFQFIGVIALVAFIALVVYLSIGELLKKKVKPKQPEDS